MYHRALQVCASGRTLNFPAGAACASLPSHVRLAQRLRQAPAGGGGGRGVRRILTLTAATGSDGGSKKARVGFFYVPRGRASVLRRLPYLLILRHWLGAAPLEASPVADHQCWRQLHTCRTYRGACAHVALGTRLGNDNVQIRARRLGATTFSLGAVDSSEESAHPG